MPAIVELRKSSGSDFRVSLTNSRVPVKPNKPLQDWLVHIRVQKKVASYYKVRLSFIRNTLSLSSDQVYQNDLDRVMKISCNNGSHCVVTAYSHPLSTIVPFPRENPVLRIIETNFEVKKSFFIRLQATLKLQLQANVYIRTRNSISKTSRIFI